MEDVETRLAVQRGGHEQTRCTAIGILVIIKLKASFYPGLPFSCIRCSPFAHQGSVHHLCPEAVLPNPTRIISEYQLTEHLMRASMTSC
jgi:hypothetical protein